jgi:hypothetical protein
LRAHLNTGHGGREKMLKEVNKKYANVTRDVLNLFKEMCEECQLCLIEGYVELQKVKICPTVENQLLLQALK